MSKTPENSKGEKAKDENSAFQDFKEMTRKLLQVKKSEIDEVEKKMKLETKGDKENIRIAKTEP